MVNTKEVVAPSQHDWKIVDRDVKQKKKKILVSSRTTRCIIFCWKPDIVFHLADSLAVL